MCDPFRHLKGRKIVFLIKETLQKTLVLFPAHPTRVEKGPSIVREAIPVEPGQLAGPDERLEFGTPVVNSIEPGPINIEFQRLGVCDGDFSSFLVEHELLGLTVHCNRDRDRPSLLIPRSREEEPFLLQYKLSRGK